MANKVAVIIEKDENGYYAYCPELTGCQSQGETFEETLKNIREAIELYVETLSQEERKLYLSKEIVTTAVEVGIA
jgi:predicted RNase H-like HicB family nuclease